MKAPVLGLYGEADAGIPVAQVEAMKAALAAAGKTAEFKIYPARAARLPCRLPAELPQGSRRGGLERDGELVQEVPGALSDPSAIVCELSATRRLAAPRFALRRRVGKGAGTGDDPRYEPHAAPCPRGYVSRRDQSRKRESLRSRMDRSAWARCCVRAAGEYGALGPHLCRPYNCGSAPRFAVFAAQELGSFSPKCVVPNYLPWFARPESKCRTANLRRESVRRS